MGCRDEGMDAMGLGQTHPQFSRLWQFPLLVVSVSLFGYAAYAFIAPKAPPSVAQRLQIARMLLKHERSDAAIAELNDILASGKLAAIHEGAARMLLGEAIDLAQQQKHISIPENNFQIIRQTETGIALGIEGDAAAYQRLAESYYALGRPADAIERYRKAVVLDGTRALSWQRRVIAIQLEQEDWDGAMASIEQYVKTPGMSGSEKAWALGEKAHVLIDRKEFKEAQDLLADALTLEKSEPSEQGRYNYWMGYCAWKLGNLPEAERHLRASRDLLSIRHPLDADAAYTLGKIRQEQKDWELAKSFYEEVLRSHPDAPVALASRMGRGVCRIAGGSEDAGLSDLQHVVRVVKEKESVPLRIRAEAISALQQGQNLLLASGNTQGVLELMAYEQELRPKPAGEFFARLAKVYERRANQLEAAPERASVEEKIRDARVKAGDAYAAYAKGLMMDPAGFAMAMRKSIEQYDLAGDLRRVIGALEAFVEQLPSDATAPDCWLRLGQSYHAAGLFDKAIAAYHKCENPEYAKSLASSKSRVPLARAYIAKGPEFYPQAESALRSVIENNPQVTPEAREFRDALLELAELFYRTGRYELAIQRLEELSNRYPGDEHFGQLLFLKADSYRKSAIILDDRIKAAVATTRPTLDIPEARKARVERLTQARDLYDRAISYYSALRRPMGDLDAIYMKLSHFYKADCVYDLGDYIEAIHEYDNAAFRYQDDPAALAAYIQIVNANTQLGRPEAAKAANERAKWMLQRMPKGAFKGGDYIMPRPMLEQWLTAVGQSGLWK